MTTNDPAGARNPPLLTRPRAFDPGAINDNRAGAPGRPPARPNGGVTVRSQQTAAWAWFCRTRHTRRTPSPPRWVPAPPLSGTNAYSSTRNGKLISRISIGVLLMLDTVLATALMPSLVGRAPKPPLTDS